MEKKLDLGWNCVRVDSDDVSKLVCKNELFPELGEIILPGKKID